MINGHGDDRYLFDQEIVADFSSNVYYEGATEGLKQHLTNHLHHISRYPEANAKSLQQELELMHDLNPGQALVTNGATEAFYLIAQACKHQTVTIVVPAFAEYEDACRINDLQVQYLPWEELKENSKIETNLIFFGNPNNPTGLIKQKKTMCHLAKLNPQTLFIIDEAYSDFTAQDVSMVDQLSNHNNLIIVKSLTKTYAIPGLRLGYLLSQADTIKKILRYKMPWSVNTLALEAGLYITKHSDQLKIPLLPLLKDTQDLIKELRQLPSITAFETHTNFFLCHTSLGTAAMLKQFLVQEYGILIRDASNFKSLNAQHFRIATQTKQKNESLLKAITAWINLTA